MNPLNDLRGIVTVLNTPFGAEGTSGRGELDVDSLERHVKYALEAGVHGFLVPAMAAEVTKLDLGERREMLQTVLRTVAGARPVVAGVYADDPETRLQVARQYVDLGVDALLVSVPYESVDSFVAAVRGVADTGAPVVMVQDWSPSGYGIPIDAILRALEEVPAFKSIKIEVAASGIKYSEVLDRTKGQLHVAGGWAVGQMMEGLDRGVHAFMPTGLHEIYVAIYNRFVSGDTEAARRLFYKLLPVLAFSNQHLDISIHFFKRLLHRQGIYATSTVREPIATFDRHHESQADYLIDYAIALMEAVRTGRE